MGILEKGDRHSWILSPYVLAESFFKQFYGSVTESEYIALREGFIMVKFSSSIDYPMYLMLTHFPANQEFDFHKHMMESLERDFRHVVGIRNQLYSSSHFAITGPTDVFHVFPTRMAYVFWLSFLPSLIGSMQLHHLAVVRSRHDDGNNFKRSAGARAITCYHLTGKEGQNQEKWVKRNVGFKFGFRRINNGVEIGDFLVIRNGGLDVDYSSITPGLKLGHLVWDDAGIWVRPNIATYGMLMGLYQKSWNVMEAEFSFSEMRNSGIVCQSAYSAIQSGKLEEAEQVLALMQEAGFCPNIVAYNTLIKGYCTVTFNIMLDVMVKPTFKKAKKLFRMVKSRGLVDVIVGNDTITWYQSPNPGVFLHCSLLTVFRSLHDAWSQFLRRDISTYLLWKHQVMLIIDGYDLLRYMSTDISAPKVLPHLTGLTTTLAIWSAISRLFGARSSAKISALRHSLHSQRKVGLTVSEYLAKVKSICDMLNAAGSLVTEQEHVSVLLAGLSMEFESLDRSFRQKLFLYESASVNMAVSSSDKDELKSTSSSEPQSQPNSKRLQQSDNFRGRGRGRFNGSNRPQCQMCGKFGHPVQKCFHRFDRDYSGMHDSTASTTEGWRQSRVFSGVNSVFPGVQSFGSVSYYQNGYLFTPQVACPVSVPHMNVALSDSLFGSTAGKNPVGSSVSSSPAAFVSTLPSVSASTKPTDDVWYLDT
ncbi:hypothetical protein F3Y22_tig00112289pilonHSYRG00165 [Hibiscus syriacus]|uniref:Pentatricopeptide repeat-containing protein n=1 Tax=Hibiscus syriacus TaxID=106335 RepID=A0A6A2X1Q1_HIBSY|nr:hypothetical protein F3Y22_tig00112289pilonHSYRG00165 [Hibiscus syriacus]